MRGFLQEKMDVLGSTSVEEYFDAISEEALDERITDTEDTEYWERCKKFFMDRAELPVATLTEKQFAWLQKIDDDLGD